MCFLPDILVKSKFENSNNFKSNFGFIAQAQQNAVREAMYAIEDISCVRFVPRTTQTDYVQVRVSGSII